MSEQGIAFFAYSSAIVSQAVVQLRRRDHRALRLGRIGQLAMMGRLTMGSSLKGATDSRVM